MTAPHDPAPEDAELHETPEEAVFALIEADTFLQQRRQIWEPACGPGQLVDALQKAGHTVWASDVYKYEGRWAAHPDTTRHWKKDFLDPETHRLKCGAEAIVMNPPFSQSDAFITCALGLVPRVYALLPLGWMQGGPGVPMRDHLLDGPEYWRRCYPFRERLPTMHRDGWTGRKARTMHKHAWFVFGKPKGREEQAAQRIGTPITTRISIEGLAAAVSQAAAQAQSRRGQGPGDSGEQ